ncbi:MAG: hypothetical protein Q8Q04_00330 [archaeon]|nr:hypothetical protein [archaeon]
MANVLQASIFTDFLYPFLLMFFIIYALLQKSKLLGQDQTQINAFVSLIVSLIFVSVVFPVIVVNNLILFMVVGVAVLFVGFILWGFINNGNITLNGKVLKLMGVLVFLSVIVAVFWATGSFPFLWEWIEKFYNFAFRSSGSESFWTNFLIVVLVVAGVAAAVKSTKAK